MENVSKTLLERIFVSWGNITIKIEIIFLYVSFSIQELTLILVTSG